MHILSKIHYGCALQHAIDVHILVGKKLKDQGKLNSFTGSCTLLPNYPEKCLPHKTSKLSRAVLAFTRHSKLPREMLAFTRHSKLPRAVCSFHKTPKLPRAVLAFTRHSKLPREMLAFTRHSKLPR